MWGFWWVGVLSVGVLSGRGFVGWGFCRVGVLSGVCFVMWGFCRVGVLSVGVLSVGVLSCGGFVRHSPRVAHSANWQRAPFSLRDHGIPSPLTLWDLYLQIDATSSWSSSWTLSLKYTILIPSSNHTASTVSEALMRHVFPYFGTPRRLLFNRAESSSAPYGRSSYALSGFSKSSLRPTTPKVTQSMRGATSRWTTCSSPTCWKDPLPRLG